MSLVNKFKKSRRSGPDTEEVLMKRLKYGRPGTKARNISPLKRMIQQMPVRVSESVTFDLLYLLSIMLNIQILTKMNAF